MKKRSYISIFSSVLFALYFVFAASVVNSNQDIVAVEQCSDSDEESENQASFSELSLDVIIPSYAFDFGIEVLIPFHLQIEFLETSPTFYSSATAGYYHFFFEKIFEHIIAPNAP
ncbi:hypothetical protein SAMN06298216_1658 [Spirosomataceae bacterium TFI 002]|nr:hypothetical protein SAMN06298216_1658 [Spirosomataceae bacterium TFI 002]